MHNQLLIFSTSLLLLPLFCALIRLAPFSQLVNTSVAIKAMYIYLSVSTSKQQSAHVHLPLSHGEIMYVGVWRMDAFVHHERDDKRLTKKSKATLWQ